MTASLALVMIARDEERFLAANLAYHHAIGVAQVYLFLDRCRDRSADVARAFPWVRVIETARRPDDRYLSDFQLRCMDAGLAMARADGHAWVLSLDPDELARPEPARGTDGGVASLPAMLSAVDPACEAVVLPAWEVVPVRAADDAPFWELTTFRVAGRYGRRLLDPQTGARRRIEGWLGHDKGKCIVRVRADVRAASAHAWIRRDDDARDRALRVERRGALLHYVVTSAAHWREKYRRLADNPPRWRSGRPVRFPKQSWKEASLRWTDDEARAYYDRWVVTPPRALVLPRLRGHVRRDVFARDVLRDVMRR